MHYRYKTYHIADIGDYLKVFACTAVISQPIMSMIMGIHQPDSVQNIFGVFYNLVKYTAPAFIFGILYTTIRTNDEQGSFCYQKHMKANWSNLFVPTIWWTLIYLLGMPWLQQVDHFHNLGTFCWQFINGNAAPHLWYNTMMLQFIILMPIFWGISCFVKQNAKRGIAVAIITFILYFTWLYFYDYYVFHGIHEHDWYLIDRIFISFFIYGVYGILAWQFRDYYDSFVTKFWWLILMVFIGCFIWTNIELQNFGHPINFNDAPYYKPSMTLYCLAVIALVSAFPGMRRKCSSMRMRISPCWVRIRRISAASICAKNPPAIRARWGCTAPGSRCWTASPVRRCRGIACASEIPRGG